MSATHTVDGITTAVVHVETGKLQVLEAMLQANVTPDHTECDPGSH